MSRVAGPRPFYSVAWDEVARAQAWPAGPALECRSGKKIVVVGLFVDAHPERFERCWSALQAR